MREGATKGPLLSDCSWVHNTRGTISVTSDQLGEATFKPSAYTIKTRLGHFASDPGPRLVDMRSGDDAFGKQPQLICEGRGEIWGCTIEGTVDRLAIPEVDSVINQHVVQTISKPVR